MKVLLSTLLGVVLALTVTTASARVGVNGGLYYKAGGISISIGTGSYYPYRYSHKGYYPYRYYYRHRYNEPTYFYPRHHVKGKVYKNRHHGRRYYKAW